MIEQDTIRLLRECDAGIKMGISSIDDVLDKVKSKELMRFLTDAKEKHTHLKHEVQALLENYNDEGKDPPLIAEYVCHENRFQTRRGRNRQNRCRPDDGRL